MSPDRIALAPRATRAGVFASVAITLAACTSDTTAGKPAIALEIRGPAMVATNRAAFYAVLAHDRSGGALPVTSIQWRVSDTSMAYVDQYGQLSGLKSGHTTLIAIAGGTEDSLPIDVVPPLAICLDDAPSLEIGCAVANVAAEQVFPSISGTRLVWKDYRYGLGVIFLYDLATGELTQVTQPSADIVNPTIHGDRIVFARYLGRGADWPLIAYDIPSHTETQFGTILGNTSPSAFRMSGDRVVYHTRRPDNWDIYLYDFAAHAETRITTDPAEQADPAIFGDRITWEDRRQGSQWWDLYEYDLSTHTERRITTDTTLARNSAITADRVVWGDLRGGTTSAFTIFAYEFNGLRHEHLLPTTLMWTGLVAEGNTLAWMDGDANVHVYDITRGYENRIVTSGSWFAYPALSPDYVAWVDERSGTRAIYVARLAELLPR